MHPIWACVCEVLVSERERKKREGPTETVHNLCYMNLFYVTEISMLGTGNEAKFV